MERSQYVDGKWHDPLGRAYEDQERAQDPKFRELVDELISEQGSKSQVDVTSDAPSDPWIAISEGE